MNLRIITAEEFVRRLKATTEQTDKRFTFFIGAGCSISSGIPAAGALVKDHWLPQLCEWRLGNRSMLASWVAQEFPDYQPQAAAAYYGPVIEKLFLYDEERQREIERHCDGRLPGFGYAVLAKLVAMDGGRFNTVLTTNFDDLIADALYLFTAVRPLVIHHESLAGFIRPTRTRPLLIKLHGDHRLSPRNTAAETAALKDTIEKQVRSLLQDRGLIFMGYGGNDVGIAKMLDALPPDALPLGVFWLNSVEPGEPLRLWLENRNAVWIQKSDFDELMLLCQHTFKFDPPTAARFDEIFKNYKTTYETLSRRIFSLSTAAPEAEALKAAAAQADQSVNAWALLQKAAALESDAPDQADTEYQRALQAFPTFAPLLNNYAMFLADMRNDRHKADAQFRAALEADKTTPLFLTNYAIFLQGGDDGEQQRAEQYYSEALALAPNDSWILDNYALYLDTVRGDLQKAATYYRRAIDVDATNATRLVNYADLLDRLGQREAAEEYYRRAITVSPADPDLRNDFAVLLEQIGRNDVAEEQYNKALSLAPSDSVINMNYADFLARIKRDFDAADLHYQRALGDQPDDVEIQVRLAGLRLAQGRQDGMQTLRTLLTSPAIANDVSAVAAEAWFYAYAHGDASQQTAALPKLKRALLAGARIPTRTFQLNVERATLSGHPQATWLSPLAAVLSAKADVSTLDPWPLWQAAGS